MFLYGWKNLVATAILLAAVAVMAHGVGVKVRSMYDRVDAKINTVLTGERR